MMGQIGPIEEDDQGFSAIDGPSLHHRFPEDTQVTLEHDDPPGIVDSGGLEIGEHQGLGVHVGQISGDDDEYLKDMGKPKA
jgi:hypothetical protein